jgi:hypothetical protein
VLPGGEAESRVRPAVNTSVRRYQCHQPCSSRMGGETSTPQAPAPRRVRFSIGTLLLWITIGALAANTIVINRQVTQLKQELASQQPLLSKGPLPLNEVARQFEKWTKLGRITTTVKDVRYSPEAESYKVKFSWADSASGKTGNSTVQLNHEGFGEYYGAIADQSFLQPLGNSYPFSVKVETPSSFQK